MTDRNRKIVEFITARWVGKVVNNSDFAKNHNLDEKTVRRIKDDEFYRTSYDTIESICEGENINLSEFFKEAEEMFPEIKIKK